MYELPLKCPRIFFLGFGVCCQHVIQETNGKVRYNRTVVQNAGFPSPLDGTAGFTFMVENIADDICFIRLDFVRVELSTVYADSTNTAGLRPGECMDTLNIM